MKILKFSDLTVGNVSEAKEVVIYGVYIQHPKQLKNCNGTSLSQEAKSLIEKQGIVISCKEDFGAKVFVYHEGCLKSRFFPKIADLIAGLREIK